MRYVYPDIKVNRWPLPRVRGFIYFFKWRCKMFWEWSIVHKLVMIIIMQKRIWIVGPQREINEGTEQARCTWRQIVIGQRRHMRNQWSGWRAGGTDSMFYSGKGNETKRNPPPAPFKTEPVLLTIFFSPRINALHKCIDGWRLHRVIG